MQSDSISEIFKAIMNVRKELGPVAKDAQNPYFNSKYATLNAVIAIAEPILQKHELAYWQTKKVIDGSCVWSTELKHASGEWIESHIPFVYGNDMQKIGSSISYARRYGLLTALGLYQEDDDGNAQTFSSNRGDTQATTAGGDDSPSAPSQYLIQFGKFKGKTIEKVPPAQLNSYLDFIKGKAEQEGKALKGQVKELVDNANAFFEGS